MYLDDQKKRNTFNSHLEPPDLCRIGFGFKSLFNLLICKKNNVQNLMETVLKGIWSPSFWSPFLAENVTEARLFDGHKRGLLCGHFCQVLAAILAHQFNRRVS